MKMNKKAFTLVELMIVIAVIGILAATALPSFKNARDRARQSKCFEYSALLSRTAELYNIDHKNYPENDDLTLMSSYMSGSRMPICPSMGEYQHVPGTGINDSGTYVVRCTIHGVASAAWSTSSNN